MQVNLKEIDVFEDIITVIDNFQAGTFHGKFGFIEIQEIEIISFEQYSLN